MRTNKMNRREMLRGLAGFGVGSSVFSLTLTRGGWAAAEAPYAFRRSMTTMGTVANITIFGESEAKSREAVRDAFAEIRRVDDLMSTHRRTTPLSRVNRAAGAEALKVDGRILDVVRASLDWSRKTEGLFDATTLPLLRAWGFREAGERELTEDQAREVVGFDGIKIEGRSLGLKRVGAEMDLGGIAKGYAVDRAANLLREKWGITRAIVEAGGDLYAMGRPDDEPGWRIGIAHPVKDGQNCATMMLTDQAVATSGSPDRRLERAGATVTDLFDPRTGQAAQALLSVTACATTAMDADAASTTGFIGGPGVQDLLAKAGALMLTIAPDSSGSLSFRETPGFPAIEKG